MNAYVTPQQRIHLNAEQLTALRRQIGFNVQRSDARKLEAMAQKFEKAFADLEKLGTLRWEQLLELQRKQGRDAVQSESVAEAGEGGHFYSKAQMREQAMAFKRSVKAAVVELVQTASDHCRPIAEAFATELEQHANRLDIADSEEALKLGVPFEASPKSKLLRSAAETVRDNVPDRDVCLFNNPRNMLGWAL